ncbi:hypothetical protein X748_15205 [Mesorhizobium sp. LNJC386A00]|nr:hypothetical protein X752_14660 [Mesorhizobium sp. LNJC398B00]ESY35834.1 hypothetical protein X748_15205 [Mesorhizobium sp. LNJC386A00]
MFDRQIVLIVLAGAIIGSSAVGIERYVTTPAKSQAVTYDPPPLPMIKKKPVRKWKWRLT